MYEASGRIKLINEVQSFPSGFTKREFVVTTSTDKYPQDLKFEVVKDKCSMLDQFEPEQEVVVSFDIRGNEYNGKYFVNLSCWKIQVAGGGGSGGRDEEYSQEPPARGGNRPAPRKNQVAEAEPSLADLRKEDDFDDDIPF
ncbi:DUF3127 domain-containing protein [Phragmitibacter flavus]|uniref:DUF3127 domain-containing protein n=2 Tax=Phragmitibacter flavus TaxID=2576071 RepID=A0A5R8KFY7_9BACT|nr:DUF3127 domain-containing protein [Phragmitibacter flavus]